MIVRVTHRTAGLRALTKVVELDFVRVRCCDVDRQLNPIDYSRLLFNAVLNTVRVLLAKPAKERRHTHLKSAASTRVPRRSETCAH